MRVENPKFDSNSDPGTVRCEECPFFDVRADRQTRKSLDALCGNWDKEHTNPCPTRETYVEACDLAEAATTEEVTK